MRALICAIFPSKLSFIALVPALTEVVLRLSKKPCFGRPAIKEVFVATRCLNVGFEVQPRSSG